MSTKLDNSIALLETVNVETQSLNESFAGDLVKSLALYMWKNHKLATVFITSMVSITTIYKAISIYKKMVTKAKTKKERSTLTYNPRVFGDKEINSIKFCKFKPSTFEVYFKWVELLRPEYDKLDSLFDNIEKILDDKNVDIDNTKPYLDKLESAVNVFNKQVSRIKDMQKNEFDKFIKMKEEAEKEEYSTDINKLKELYKKMDHMFDDFDGDYYINTDGDDAWEGIAFLYDVYYVDHHKYNEDKDFERKVDDFYEDVLNILVEIDDGEISDESWELYPDAKVQFTGNAPKEK